MDEQFVAGVAELLQQVTSGDSDVIQKASQQLQKQVYKNDKAIPSLIYLMQYHNDPSIRQLAGVEARKQVINRWDDLDDAIQEGIRQEILQTVLREEAAPVKHSSARVISAIASFDMPAQKWDKLAQFLFSTSLDQLAGNRQTAIYILYTILDTMDEASPGQNAQLLSIFARTIDDPESLQVRSTTLLALGKLSELMIQTDDAQDIKRFSELVPNMVNVLQQVIEDQDEKLALQAFDVFTTLLIIDGGLISKHFKDLIEFMVNLALSKNIDSEFRRPAIQLLITALRYKKPKFASLKIGALLVEACLAIATEDDYPDADDDEDETTAQAALYLIDTLSTSLPPSQVAAPLINSVGQYFTSADPAKRRGAYLALGSGVEGAPDYYASRISDILPYLVKGLNDDVVNVRMAALRALSQIASETREAITKEHKFLLPLVSNLVGTSDLKVGKAACAALDSILENMERADIASYLPSLLPNLLHLLNQPSDPAFKSIVIAAIGSAAHASESAFLPYFEQTARAFEPYLQFQSGDAELDLRGMTLDALGSVAQAVGKECFSTVVEPLCQSALQAFEIEHCHLHECAFVFMAVIARLYGPDFVPFLAPTLKHIAHCLNQPEADDEKEDEDDMVPGDEDDEEGRFAGGINSGIAMEKEIAIDSLGDIIAAVKEHFVPYYSQILEPLTELSGHYYDGIRKAAISTLWRAVITLYETVQTQKWVPGYPAKVPLHPDVQSLLESVVPVTEQILGSDEEPSVITAVFNSLTSAVRTCGPGVITDLEGIVTDLLAVLLRKHICQTLEDDEDAAAPEGEAAEYDEFLQDTAFEFVAALAEAFGTDFAQLYPVFFTAISNHIASSQASERVTGVGTLAEVIEGMKEAIVPFAQEASQVLLKTIKDSNEDVRGNAAYGIGLLCYYASDQMLNLYPTILQSLEMLFRAGENKSDRTTANACGCIARMGLKHPQALPLDIVVPHLISLLPLRDGLEENDPIFEFIGSLYEHSNPAISANVELTNQFLQALKYAFEQQQQQQQDGNTEDDEQSQFSQETKVKMIQLCRYLSQQSPSLQVPQILLN